MHCMDKGGEMLNKKQKIMIGFFSMIILITSVALAVPLFTNALVSFSGIRLVNNGSTTQGFIDISLKNIDTPGLSFCLSYNTNYIQLSDVKSNIPIENRKVTATTPYPFNVEHKYFDQNIDAFPISSNPDKANVFRDGENAVVIGPNLPIIGIADQDQNKETGYLIMNFLPKEDAAERSDYIENKIVDDNDGKEIVQPVIMANDVKDGLKLGSLSFYIKNPEEFAKLSKEELSEIIKIVPFSEMMTVQDEKISGEDGVYLSYIDENGDTQWYSRSDKNIEYEFDIDVELEDVQPKISNFSVSAYDIYKQGTIQDLFDYLSEHAADVILTYADNSKVPGTIEWNPDNCSLNTYQWNPKSGNYTITQKYNDNLSVTVEVSVTPVNISGIDIDNRNITYLYGSENFPTTFEQLNLASKAKLILDTYIPNGGIPAIDIGWYTIKGTSMQIQTLPDDFADGNAHSYIFVGVPTYEVSGDGGSESIDIFKKYPWLSGSTLPEIEIIRNVVINASDMPHTLEVITAETNKNGILKINVKNTNDLDIPENTKFEIRLPDGTLIDPTIYTVEYNGTTATIDVSPDITDNNQQKIAQIINLGSRVGAFTIASKEPDKNIGVPIEFRPKPRRNIYISDTYAFDYSGSDSLLLPIKAGTGPSTTITLPLKSDRIATTYSGYDGMVPGELETFTVNEWLVIDGDPSIAGSIVEVKGQLANTVYTNYGSVFNDENVTVTLKYRVSNIVGEDSIEPIADFTFNTQHVGYDYDKLQMKSFIIKNNGTTDINGLTAVISLSEDQMQEAFVEVNTLPAILSKAGSATLDISTKHGLAVGIYTSTVTLYSYDKELGSFKINFEVTDKPVHTITVKVKEGQEDFGKVKTKMETYTAIAGTIITVIAEPIDDCNFVEWTIEPDSVSMSTATGTLSDFTMPDEDVVVTASFKEKLIAKLRATELYIKDASENNQELKDKTWKQVKYDPATREYYVAVSSDTEEVSMWFKPRTEAKDADKEVTCQQESQKNGVNIIPPETDEDYYKTDNIILKDSPVDNILELKLKATDLEEGMQTGTYTIHIYKKLELKDLVEYEYGNSPYGLIMRDTAIIQKEDSKKAFVENGYSFIEGSVPNGADAGVIYSLAAWEKPLMDYDLDDSALFVINSEEFEDPGYKKLTNSIGQTIADENVSKSVTVKVLAETIESEKNGSSADFAYLTNPQDLIIDLPDTGPITQLKDKRIRPDCYNLVYSFTDYDGEPISVSRPLILIYSLGDINVDNQINTQDTSSILNRYKLELANDRTVPDYITGGLLYRYRICDANKDCNINAIDANYIRANVLNPPFYKNSMLKGGGA